MKPKDFIQGNTSWEHFCNRLGAGSFNHWSLLRTISGLKVAHRFSFDRVFLQGSTFLTPYTVNIEILRGVSWEVGWGWVSKIESLDVYVVSWDVGSGWVGTHAWCNMQSCSGKTQKRDVCVRWKSSDLKVCSVFWDVGARWVGTHAWCNMESCSGKIQNRDVWDEKVRIWSL